MSPEQTPEYRSEIILDKLLASRRSVRTYTSKPVPEQMIRSMVAAAMTAPSPSNSQPVRFLNIVSEPMKDALKKQMDAGFLRLSSMAKTLEKPRKTINVINYYWRYATFMLDAPVLMAVATVSQENSFSHRLKQANLLAADFRENTDIDITTGLSLAAFILKALELGLGTCILTAPLFFVQDPGFLSQEKGLHIKCFVTIGFSDETPVQPGRLSMEQVYSHV
ncbi:MAG: nitroreductase family protein [Pseudomonadota bacterium]